MKQQIYITGLYLRLSRDDEQQGESSSISTQRQKLTQFCHEQGLRMGTSLYAQSPHGKIQGTKIVHLYAVQRVRQG